MLPRRGVLFSCSEAELIVAIARSDKGKNPGFTWSGLRLVLVGAIQNYGSTRAFPPKLESGEEAMTLKRRLAKSRYDCLINESLLECPLCLQTPSEAATTDLRAFCPSVGAGNISPPGSLLAQRRTTEKAKLLSHRSRRLKSRHALGKFLRQIVQLIQTSMWP